VADLSYPVSKRERVPVGVFKLWEDLERHLEVGWGDFIVDCQDWHGPPPRKPHRVVEIDSWGDAVRYWDKGFYFEAGSIEDAGRYASWVAEYGDEHDILLIYCRVSIPGVTKMYVVDRYLKYL
jgi:hypothetical protein